MGGRHTTASVCSCMTEEADRTAKKDRTTQDRRNSGRFGVGIFHPCAVNAHFRCLHQENEKKVLQE